MKKLEVFKTESPTTIEYKLADGRYHRADGPAIESKVNLSKFWYNKGHAHRLFDGPAAVYACGCATWYKNSMYHRTDGPAIITCKTCSGSSEEVCYYYLNNAYFGDAETSLYLIKAIDWIEADKLQKISEKEDEPMIEKKKLSLKLKKKIASKTLKKYTKKVVSAGKRKKVDIKNIDSTQETLDLIFQEFKDKYGQKSESAKEISGLLYPQVDETFVIKPGLNKLFQHLLINSRETNRPENVLLKGVQGCGKTETCLQFAAYAGLPVLKLNCSLVRESRDWFGSKTASDGTVSWVKSEFSKLLERGGAVILLDEITRASPPVLNCLIPLLDGTGQTFLEEVKEVVKRGPNVFFFATANIGSQFTGTYGNLDSALDDRFAIRVECDYLPKEDEIALLMARTKVNKVVATKLIEVAGKIRAAASGKLGTTLSATVSTRVILDTAKLYNSIGDEAFNYTIVPLFSSKGGTASQQASVLQIIQSQFGGTK